MKRIIWGLAIIIIPAFVIWGAGTSDKKKREGPDHAGKVFNRKVSFEEYIDMWRVTRDYAIRTFGDSIPPEVIDQLTWNRIILLEEAKRKNIVVKDEEIVERILSFPIFQRDGSFDKKLYKSILGDSTKNFEEKLRDDIRISKVNEKITSNISVTDEEVKEAYRKKFEKIKASYISIPFVDFEKKVQYEETDLIKFYEENKENFRKPDEINVKYIEVPLSHFDKEIDIKEEAIERYFEEHISDYKEPDSDKMPILNDATKKDISERLAQEKKESLLEELAYRVLDKAIDKKDLDEVGLSFTLETKETGFFNMQEEIPGIGWSYEFTKRGFELEPGQISNVLIKISNAFYIIQLKEQKPSYIPEFIETKDSVKENYIKSESIKLSRKNIEKVYIKIDKKINKSKKTFEDIVKGINLESSETDFIARDGYIPTLGPAKEFVEHSLSLKDKEISHPIKMQQSWVIVKLDEYQGMDEAKFIEENDSFKEDFLTRKKQESFNKWFQELKEEANFVSYTLE